MTTPTTPKLPEPATGAPFPPRILAMIQEAASREYIKDADGNPCFGPMEDGNGEPLQDDADAALRWLSDAQALAGEVERLRAEVAALTADAERYRWLRDMSEWEPFDASWLCQQDIYGQFPTDMDAALDASRALATQEAKA